MALQYDKIIKYRASATCMQPLHIGNAMGTGEEVLVHPVDEIPFIQAAGIAGVFRDYFTRAEGAEAAARLFGTDRRRGGLSEEEKKEAWQKAGGEEAGDGGAGEMVGRETGQKAGVKEAGDGGAGEMAGQGDGQKAGVEAAEDGGAGEMAGRGTGQKVGVEAAGTDTSEEARGAAGDSSRIRFTDGTFLVDEKKEIRMELRPRLAIDPVTGTCSGSTIKGTDKRAGHKFNTEYVGAGAEFEFCVYLYDPGYQKDVEDIFAALNSENIQFGGQKSNGCGYVGIERLQRAVFDMKNPADRKKWAGEESMPDEAYEDLDRQQLRHSGCRNAYEITVTGRTEGELLVKSIAVTEEGENAPDAVNIRNARGEYIVPGSSLKGAVRSQMAKIAAYLHCEELIEQTFGRKEDGKDAGKGVGSGKDSGQGKNVEEGKGLIGNISFFDTVVGETAANDKATVQHRIHIDKFTGGVMTGALFSQKNVSGKMTLRIMISDRNTPDKSCGLLLLALRDLAVGTMSLGSGYNIGKGIMVVDTITIKGKDGSKAEIKWKTGNAKENGKTGEIEDESGLIARVMAALYGSAES